MGTYVDCQDARNMKTILEVTCPKCHEEEAVEVIIKDGITVGESVCSFCGHIVPEGLHLAEIS